MSAMTLEEQEQKEQAIAAVLKRAAFAKTARNIKQRLALAAYKAQNGLQAVSFDQIEPKAEEQMRKRKARQSMEVQQPALKRQATGKAADGHPTTTAFDANHPFPPSMSLYDAMMTPNLHSVYGSFSPRLSEPFTEPSGANPHRSPPRLKTIIQTDPVTGLQHPSSPVSSARDETPFHRPESPIGKPRSPAHRRTGSLPANALVATSKQPGLVQAANALASLTRGPSEEPIPAKAFDRVTPPPAVGPSATNSAEKKSPRSTSAPAFGSHRSRSKTGPEGGDRETAAELMLYLASSPSPQQKKTMDAFPGSEEPMKARKLFAEELNALEGFPTPERVASAPPRQLPQPLQPQKMPQIPDAMQLQQQQQYLNNLPPFSTAESYVTQMHSAPLFYSHPANLQPSFSMNALPPASYPMSYSMPASAPPDLKGDPSQLYFAQSVPPPSMNVHPPRNAPPFDMAMYMNQAQGNPYAAMPQYQQPFGQTW